jgi:putative hydrolase of the HAD superfamily
MKLAAITLDLDDTLWPITPVMQRAEQALQDWLAAHCPEVAAALPLPRMRALRDRVFAEYPELSHDFTALRKLCLRAALLPYGYGEHEVDEAFAVFYAARNQVELYPEVGDALERLARRAPLVSLSNGNACLARIGLSGHFKGQVTARAHGAPKPAASIFHAACAIAGADPAHTLHVGDHPEQDVTGALNAGLAAAWIDRKGCGWPLRTPAPLTFPCLARLADYVEGL